jgi:hypothetical protein
VKLNKIRNAFLTFEYTLLIIIVVGALLGMSFYFRRAISGAWRAVGDTFGHGRQYSYPETKRTCYDGSGNPISCDW